MGCTYTGSIDGDRLASSEAEVTKLAKMLCRLCKKIEIYEDQYCDLVLEDPELRDWWLAHKKLDQKRIEKIRDEAWRKIENILSEEEMKAIGL